MRIIAFSLISLVCVVGCGDDESGPFSAPGRGGATGGGGSPMGGAATGGSSGSSGSSGFGGTQAGRGGSSTGGSSGSSGSTGKGGVIGTDCTQFFNASAGLDAIEGALNSSSGGSVICLERGASYTGTLRINNAAPTASERVIVCASAADDECSAGDSANPRIVGMGGGIVFDSGSDGFVIANVDITCAADCGGAYGVDLAGASHVRFEGGLVSGWDQAFICNPFSTDAPCDDIEVGIPDNVTELVDNEQGFFGWLSNSYVRIDARDNGDGTVLTHPWYLSSGPQESPSTNVVFEYGFYTRSSVADGVSLGTFLNLSGQNRDIVVRHNVFEEPACGTWIIDCSSGGEDPEEFCDGIEVYGNTFRSDCPVALHLEATQRARVFNNVFVGNGQLMEFLDGERPAGDAWFFNNTVHCSENCETALRFDGNGHRVFNNLFHYPSGGGEIVEAGDGACSLLGSAGANLVNNFLYAPGNSPRLPDCGTGNSTAFDMEPSFVAASDQDFHITSASPVAGFGTGANAPATDFDGITRPDPPSAGAFDVP